jgi:S1-C subfamily serine protease
MLENAKPMTMEIKDALSDLSAAVERRTAAAKKVIAELHLGETSTRTGTVWRPDIVIASEQSLPKVDALDVVLASGPKRAQLAGRDPGTNIAVFKLETPVETSLPGPGEAQVGRLAFAFGADGHGGISAHLGSVTSAGPEWHSRAGGRIDRRIHLGVALLSSEEGGPVVDANGHLLGISTLGPHGRILVIPASTVERVVDPLLAHGRIERGWLGLALQPVSVPDSLRATAGQESGLMVMSTLSDGPAARAGIVAGDILLQIGGVAVTRLRKLAEQLGPESVGRQVEVRLIRAGAIVSVTPVVGPRPKNGC